MRFRRLHKHHHVHHIENDASELCVCSAK